MDLVKYFKYILSSSVGIAALCWTASIFVARCIDFKSPKRRKTLLLNVFLTLLSYLGIVTTGIGCALSIEYDYELGFLAIFGTLVSLSAVVVSILMLIDNRKSESKMNSRILGYICALWNAFLVIELGVTAINAFTKEHYETPPGPPEVEDDDNPPLTEDFYIHFYD